MSTKNFYNFYTIFRDLKNGLTLFLDEKGIDYSLTGNLADWAFCVLCTEEERKAINRWLDMNTIGCE